MTITTLIKKLQEDISWLGYNETEREIIEHIKCAITLLKEQEAVEPEMYCVGQDKYKFYRCPACKTAWYYKGNYCLGCGRKVRWDG